MVLSLSLDESDVRFDLDRPTETFMGLLAETMDDDRLHDSDDVHCERGGGGAGVEGNGPLGGASICGIYPCLDRLFTGLSLAWFSADANVDTD
jgi:hypothetical protein